MTSCPTSFEAPADFVDLTDAPGIAVDLRYASARNFLGRDVYGPFNRLLLHRIAADKLTEAAARLATARPELKLLVLDGLRPNRVQRLFWAAVEGTPHQKYVGDPATGSIHSFGFAVDLTLSDRDGRELDMGTPFDAFTPLAEPCREIEHRRSGALGEAQLDHRLLLRRVMEAAGFLPIPIEWWHFDALPPDEVRRRFSLIE